MKDLLLLKVICLFLYINSFRIHYMKVVFLACLFTFNSFGIIFGQEDIRWIKWSELEAYQQSAPKKVYIDIYTEWCGWCKKMDKTTFKDPAIVEYLNNNFYCIKFDAETKEELFYNGEKYTYIKLGKSGYHKLAAQLMQGKMSYPTSVFLDEKNTVIQPIAGFIDTQLFEQIIHYFGSNSHKSIPWAKYNYTSARIR